MNSPDPELLGRLLDERGAALTLYARQWCGTPEDVVQEAFLQLARQAEFRADTVASLYRGSSQWRPISASRAEGRRRRHEAVAATDASTWFVKESIEMTLDAQTAAEALKRLPLEECEVIVAHVWGGLTFEQIAELVGSTSSTAHRRYQAGLLTLKHLLGEPCQQNKIPAKNCPKN